VKYFTWAHADTLHEKRLNMVLTTRAQKGPALLRDT